VGNTPPVTKFVETPEQNIVSKTGGDISAQFADSGDESKEKIP
jgi:hypothetical protein